RRLPQENMSQIISRFTWVVFALSFFSAIEPYQAFGQSQTTGRVKGIVRNTDTQAPIPGAVVMLTNLAKDVPDSTKTNAAGEYTFDFVETGEYRLSTTCDGYD